MDDELTIDQVDAWVRSRLADSVVGDIKQLEVDQFAVFMKEYGQFVEQFEVQYSALVEALEAANFVDRTNWPQHRYVQFALLSYNVKTFEMLDVADERGDWRAFLASRRVAPPAG